MAKNLVLLPPQSQQIIVLTPGRYLKLIHLVLEISRTILNIEENKRKSINR